MKASNVHYQDIISQDILSNKENIFPYNLLHQKTIEHYFIDNFHSEKKECFRVYSRNKKKF